MAFNLIEVSTQDGSPVALYDFRIGTTHYRYTNADRTVAFSGHDYTAVPCADTGVRQPASGSGDSDFTVTLPADADICLLYRGTPPSLTAWLTVRRRHPMDEDDEAPVVWTGQVRSVRPRDGVSAEVLCQLPDMRQTGLRLCWERNCTHYLFSPYGCKLDKADFAVPATLTAVDGLRIYADAIGDHPVGWFDGGFVEWDIGLGEPNRRGFEVGGNMTSLKLLTSTEGLTVGMDVTLYPGCDLLDTTCDTKFDNLPNFGGVKLSGRSPFDGNPVF